MLSFSEPRKRARVASGGMRGAILSVVVCLAWTSTARGTTEIFTSFKDISSLTLSGNAQQVETNDGWVLRLTPAKGAQNGSAFGTTTVSAAQFYSSFAFRLSEPGGTAPDSNGRLGADGFTFAIQRVSASLGSRGGGLGIEQVSPSVAIEFDTYRNADYKDPSSNHIGIDIDGVVMSIATVDVTEPFNDGNIWYAWIDCDASTITVSVSQDGIRPEVPQLSYPINVEKTIGDKFAYVGFTAATGGGFQNHDVLSWVYLDYFVAADAGVPTLDGGNLPDGGDPLDGAPGDDGGTDDRPNLSDGGPAADASDDRPASDDAGADGAGLDGSADGRLPKRGGGCGCDAGAESPSLMALGAACALLLALGRRRQRR